MSWLDRLTGLFRAVPSPPTSAADVYDHTGRRRDSVYNPLTGLGGLGDKGAVGRPSPYVRSLDPRELRNLFVHNGITRRICEIIPGRATRRGWTVPEIGAEDSRLQTWGRVREAMTWARLYGGSILLMATEDDVPVSHRNDPRGWLRQPLDLARVGRVAALQVFDANEAQPCMWDANPMSPTFRLPIEWQIAAGGFNARVHGSRVIHFRGARRPLSDGISGLSGTLMPDDSCLQPIWDEVRRLTETLQGGAILAHEIRESVLKIANLASRATGDEAADLDARIALMSRTKALIGITIVGEGDDYQNRSNPPTGFTELTAAAWEALAAVTGIPQVILMGSTPGGLNTDGESSWEGFRQLVSSYQEDNRHELERLYQVIYAAQDGPTGGRAPDGWALVFASLDEPNEAKLAETRAETATMDAANIAAGVYSAADVARSRFGEGGWSIDMLPVAVPEATNPTPLVGIAVAVSAIVSQVAAGTMPRDAGIAQAARLYGIREEEATPLFGSAGAGFVPAPPPAGPRFDASPRSCCVLVPAADPGLRATVEAAIGQTLLVEDDPHVTVLYLGELVDPATVSEVVEAVKAEAGRGETAVLERAVLRAFPHGPSGTPIVAELEDAWSLGGVHERLLRGLAHLVTAKQHPRFRPHVTVGYAPAPLSAEAATALLGIDVSAVRVPVAELRVVVGRQVVVAVQVGG